MTSTRTFTENELNELNIGPWRPHHVEIIEEARWHILKAITFEYEDKFWQVDYMDPSTEMQEGQEVWLTTKVGDDWVVTAREVEKVYAIVEQWKPIGEAGDRDPAVDFIIGELIDDLHDMNDGFAPFGYFANGESVGANAIKISPDPNPEHWSEDEGPDPEYDRIPEHRDLPEGTAPETPVVLVVAQRVK